MCACVCNCLNRNCVNRASPESCHTGRHNNPMHFHMHHANAHASHSSTSSHLSQNLSRPSSTSPTCNIAGSSSPQHSNNTHTPPCLTFIPLTPPAALRIANVVLRPCPPSTSTLCRRRRPLSHLHYILLHLSTTFTHSLVPCHTPQYSPLPSAPPTATARLLLSASPSHRRPAPNPLANPFPYSLHCPSCCRPVVANHPLPPLSPHPAHPTHEASPPPSPACLTRRPPRRGHPVVPLSWSSPRPSRRHPSPP